MEIWQGSILKQLEPNKNKNIIIGNCQQIISHLDHIVFEQTYFILIFFPYKGLNLPVVLYGWN